jgi:hypothetical protein
MPTAQEIRDAIDSRMAGLLPQIAARQALYRAGRGRYWQGLETHAGVPEDGAQAAPDRLTAHPTDQPEDWAGGAMGPLPATLPMTLAVDVYDGPRGQGYVVRAQVRIAGQLWRRTFAPAVGAETGRATSGWSRVAVSSFAG